MKVNPGNILEALKADLSAASTYKKDIDIKIQGWTSEYFGRPYGNEEDGKSKIVSRDIKKQSEWQHASIVDPFVSTSEIVKCNPITAEDVPGARQNELLLNTQFVRKFNRYNFMNKAIKVLDMEGTLVVQTGWEYKETKELVEVESIAIDEFGNEFITTEEVEEVKVLENKPTAKVCRNEDIYIDPTAQDDLDNAQFVIYRYESDISTLKADGRYKNLSRLGESSEGSPHNASDYYTENYTYFKFKDEARKKQLVYEYWGNYDVNGDGIAEPIVCAWVGNTIIRLEENPYPDGKPPFIVVPFNSVPFQMHGEANAELIGDNQKVKTAVLRGILDNMAQSNNSQIGVAKGALDVANRRKFLAGNNFEYNGTPNDFWQGSYNNIPGSVFDVLGLMNNEIESITGVKSFSGGINGNSLGSTATGARGAMDATSVRRMNIVRNIAENLVKPLIRKWMAYNAEFLEDEEVVRVTNEEFVPIRKDDLSGRIDIDITVATAEDNAAKSQELSFLLQTLGPSEDPAIRRTIMADIMELMRMPEQAKRMREYQPEPDPAQEQLKQLELQKLMLENKKLMSEIQRNEARAGEDQVDIQLKSNKAAVEAAKARKLGSDADMQDMKFLKEDEGLTHKEKMELKEFDRLANLDSLAFQAKYGGKNEQLGVKS